MLAAGQGAVDAGGSAVQQLLDNGSVDWGEVGFAAATGAFGAALSQKWYDASCFTGDTQLDTPEGRKRIDAFVVGDALMQRDEFDPEAPVTIGRVEVVFVRTGLLFEVTVNGRRIETTAEHPFYVVGQGWTPAGRLAPGTVLLGRDGRCLVVDGVQNTGRTDTVYNLRVSPGHTYFVSNDDWGFSVWVHNANYVTANCPGRLHQVVESFSNASAAFQKAAAGLSRGYAYIVKGVKFDGFKYGKLLDAKGFGYAWRLNIESHKYGIASRLLAQADRQLAAAGDTPIQWRFAEKKAAAIVKDLLFKNGIAIDVIHFRT
jgi:hypothetical protein